MPTKESIYRFGRSAEDFASSISKHLIDKKQREEFESMTLGSMDNESFNIPVRGQDPATISKVGTPTQINKERFLEGVYKLATTGNPYAQRWMDVERMRMGLQQLQRESGKMDLHNVRPGVAVDQYTGKMIEAPESIDYTQKFEQEKALETHKAQLKSAQDKKTTQRKRIDELVDQSAKIQLEIEALEAGEIEGTIYSPEEFEGKPELEMYRQKRLGTLKDILLNNKISIGDYSREVYGEGYEGQQDINKLKEVRGKLLSKQKIQTSEDQLKEYRVKKPFKSGGKSYKKGDPIRIDPKEFRDDFLEEID